MGFVTREYNIAATQYDETWIALDDTLLKLCRDHPDHGSWKSICAKLWIIGRTYNTGVERSIISKKKQGSSLTQLAEQIHAKRHTVDEIIGDLRKIDEPLNPKKAERIVELHGRFTALITPITRNNQSPRSFVSKYLHFHVPVVPIIDSYADLILAKIIPLRDATKMNCPATGDGYYCEFVRRFVRLYEMATEYGVKPTVKRLDAYLLWKADQAGDARPEAAAMGAV